jgi:hypothetical protein
MPRILTPEEVQLLLDAAVETIEYLEASSSGADIFSCNMLKSRIRRTPEARERSNDDLEYASTLVNQTYAALFYREAGAQYPDSSWLYDHVQDVEEITQIRILLLSLFVELLESGDLQEALA